MKNILGSWDDASSKIPGMSYAEIAEIAKIKHFNYFE